MDYISTLISANEDEFACYQQALTEAGAQVKAVQGHQIIFTLASGPLPVALCDILTEPYPSTAKKLLISDMDSTMIEQECIDELAGFVGKKDYVAAITERAMNGELDFASALRERVALLAGLEEETLQQCFDERITLMPGAEELIAAFKAQGGKAVLVSGGFTFFTERVAKTLGFDEHYANILEVKDGCLTGKVIEPILGKEAKRAELNRQCELLAITPANVMAIGDGANDLPMLQAAGLGVAYRAKTSVQAQVISRINYHDLSALRAAIPPEAS